MKTTLPDLGQHHETYPSLQEQCDLAHIWHQFGKLAQARVDPLGL